MQKGQSTTEYLLVYVLAILVVAIALALLFYLGVFSAGSTRQNTATGFVGFGISQNCVNGTLNMTVTNTQTFPVEVTGINSTFPGAVNSSKLGILQTDQSQVFNLSNACPSKSSSKYSSYVIIIYNESSSDLYPGPYFSNGTISGMSAVS